MLARTGRQPWLDLLGDIRIGLLPASFILFWIVVPAMAIIRFIMLFYQWMRDALPEAGAARTKDGWTALQVEGGRVIEVGGVRA